MGLDIYAGTLTRYYSRNWKAVTQKWAEANGLGFQIMRPNEDYNVSSQNDEMSIEQIQNEMQEWSNTIANGLTSSTERNYEAWEENNEKDYFTDKPDWNAFGALLLYGACLKYNLPLPEKVKKGWDYQKDPIIIRTLNDSELNWSLFSEWWLPFDDCFSFNYTTPNGNEISISTTGALLEQLQKINELGWGAEESVLLNWSKTEGTPAESEVIDGTYNKIETVNEYDVQSLAKLGFSILYQAALFSKKHRVPILMDY